MNADAWMRSFARGIIRFRWLVLCFVVLITGGLVYATKYLTVNNDYDTWMPENDRVTELYLQVDHQFGANALVFAVLDCSEEGVFNPACLGLVQRLTDALEEIPELFNVTSLTNVLDIRKAEGGVEVGDLIPEIPDSRDDLERLKGYVLSQEMYVNTLISPDAKYTVLAANIEGGADEGVAAEKVLGTIREVVGDHPYYFGGDPALIVYMDRYMNRDLAFLVPVMLVVMVLILGFSFRRFWGVVLPLSFVFLSISWTFGIQALCGMYANVLTPSVVVLLIALGADYAVHIYNHYLRQGEIEGAVVEITPPVIMSALTTIAGLLTFATTRIAILRFFGYELAFGLGSACLLSVVLLPVCIRLFRVRPEEAPGPAEKGGKIHPLSRLLMGAGSWIHGHGRWILLAAVFLLCIMVTGLSRFTTDVNYVELLPKDCPPRRGHRILRDHFGGIYPLSLYFRGDMADPALLKMEHESENYLRSFELLSGFTSISGLLAQENWLMNGVYAIPETREGVANLWFLLEGEPYLKTFVTPGRDRSLVTAMIREPDTRVMKEIFRAVRGFLEERTSDRVVTVDPTRLAPEGRRALRALRISDAASQVAWLARGYDKPHPYAALPIERRLVEDLAGIDERVDLRPVWRAARNYLEEETVEVLPAAVVGRVMERLRERPTDPAASSARDGIVEILLEARVMDAEDAGETADGVLRRVGFALRVARASALRSSLGTLLPSRLLENPNFVKRVDGVLWRLWSERPVFFSSRVEGIPGIQEAVVSSRPLELDQTGAPAWFKRMDELLYASQVQSLALASVIVFVLVSVTQLSIRRGLISLASVLVPLGAILGLLSWLRIPLDFGTVLVGALIIGLGVDGSIHFLHYHHRLVQQGVKGGEALRTVLGHVGKAIVTANATTCCGFLVLVFSSTKALRNFAVANALAILLVTVSILTFLPALVTLFEKEGEGRRVSSDRGERDS